MEATPSPATRWKRPPSSEAAIRVLHTQHRTGHTAASLQNKAQWDTRPPGVPRLEQDGVSSGMTPPAGMMLAFTLLTTRPSPHPHAVWHHPRRASTEVSQLGRRGWSPSPGAPPGIEGPWPATNHGARGSSWHQPLVAAAAAVPKMHCALVLPSLTWGTGSRDTPLRTWAPSLAVLSPSPGSDASAIDIHTARGVRSAEAESIPKMQGDL